MPHSSLMTRASLLLRIHDMPDDSAAWEEFVRIYGGHVLRWCQQHGLQANDAQDVAQDVLVKFWRQAESFEYDPDHKFRGYLRRIVSSAVSNWSTRRRRSIRELVTHSTPLDAEGEAVVADLVEQVRDIPLAETDSHSRRRRADGFAEISTMLSRASSYSAALACLDVEQGIREDLARGADANPEDVAALLSTLQRRCFCFERSGRFDDAITTSRQIVQHITAHPSAASLPPWALAEAKGRLASFLALRRFHDEADGVASGALDDMQHAVALKPNDPQTALQHLVLLHNMALAARLAGDPDTERDRWMQLSTVAAAAQRRFSTAGPEFLKAESTALEALAMLTAQQHGWDAAVPLAERRWKLCSLHAAAGASPTVMHRELIASALLCHRISAQLGRHSERAEMLAVARRVAEAAAEAMPMSFDYASLLAFVLHAEAECLHEQGDDQRATAVLEQEVAALQAWAGHQHRGQERRNVWPRHAV